MIYKNSNAFSFGKQEKKGDVVIKANLTIPGPGTYENEGIVSLKATTFSFPKERKFNSPQHKTPGPGQYEGTSKGLFGKEAPKFSMGKTEKKDPFGATQTKGNGGNPVPGPGHYEITPEVLDKTKKRAISAKMSQTPKLVSYDNKTPGPGKYQEKALFGTLSPKYAISKSKRETSEALLNKAASTLPGPGNYQIEPVIGKEAPKVALRGKPKEIGGSKTPGPGSYKNDTAMFLQRAPAYRLGHTERKDIFGLDKNTEPLPGPGMYKSVSDFDLEDAKKTKGPKFGKDEKLKWGKSNTPGPGYYKVPCAMVSVPLYTGGKFEQEFKFV